MKKYLITSPQTYKYLEKQINTHLPDYVLFRDKEREDYDGEAKKFIQLCSKFDGVKSFIHQKVDLAKSLNAKGVHLTSEQFGEIKYAKELGLEVIISTHTHKEVVQAQNLGADMVTYSPIFTTPNKGEAKGIEDLKKLLDKCQIKVFALGGVVDLENVESLKSVKPYGFASIRYFF